MSPKTYHVASELRYYGRCTIESIEPSTGHRIVRMSDGRRGRVAVDQIFATKRDALANVRSLAAGGGWSDAAKLSQGVRA